MGLCHFTRHPPPPPRFREQPLSWLCERPIYNPDKEGLLCVVQPVEVRQGPTSASQPHRVEHLTQNVQNENSESENRSHKTCRRARMALDAGQKRMCKLTRTRVRPLLYINPRRNGETPDYTLARNPACYLYRTTSWTPFTPKPWKRINPCWPRSALPQRTSQLLICASWASTWAQSVICTRIRLFLSISVDVN